MSLDKLFETYGKIVNAGFKFGFTCYYWDKAKKELCYSHSSIRRVIFNMYMKILVTYKIFLVLRSIQTLGWEENDAYTKVTVIYFVGGFMAYAVNEIVILNSVGIFERLVNNSVSIGYQFFRSHSYMLILNGITVVLFAFISINITMGVRYSPSTSQSQAKEHNLFVKYHSFLSVLQQHFNAVFGKWTLGNIVASSGGICVNTFLCVSHLHSPLRSFIVAAMGCFVLLNMYNSLGQLYEQSKETLFSWRIGTRFSELQKFHRACRPLKTIN
ncbi:unnamed protein product [Allacma fusca]|uniref:Uncharacterized protein n=1 Tax=Allacma fusca TaxID=39272 RepID=A0A8J2JIE2_9HEXA|nr:unnamed protein product [Allacma fusca]